MKSVTAFAICSWLCFVICGPQLVAGMYSIVYGPGAQVPWYEAGVLVTIPPGFVARKDRSHAVLELFLNEDLPLADLQTVALRNNPAEILESGVVGLINTFCLNPGTSLQDMLQVAPYYLLDNSTSVADILFFDPASADVTDGGATQGELRSNTTDNSALMTLVGNAVEGIGVSIVLITQTVDTDALKNATSSILQGLTIHGPLVPRASGHDFRSWTEVLNDQRLSVTTVAARPLDSYFDAYSNGSCTAVLQGASHRQGTWSMMGKCLNESTLFGNVYHAIGLETPTGNIHFGSQRWSVGQAIPEANAGSYTGGTTHTNSTAASPCTFTQPAGTVAAPGECRKTCVLPDGTAALPNTPCTIGLAPETTCTTCASVFGNLVSIDISALPPRVNTTYVEACGANCPYVEYLEMLQYLMQDVCNASCVANEVNWAASKLMQPVNISACNSHCQQLHEEFMLQSQLANLPSAPAASSHHRKLQLDPRVCYGAEYDPSTDWPCPMPTPEQLAEDETCFERIAKCNDCPQPAAQHPEVGCWYGVYVDNSGSPDSTFCTNCADDAKMNAAADAASNPSGNSPTVNVGQIVTGALEVLIAL